MNLTTKGRYAVMAMVDLATNGGNGPVVLSDIAHRQNIAISYLEQIFMRLRKSGLVKSVRGPGGGYFLSKGIENTNISEIVSAVDESIKMTRCGADGSGCVHDQKSAKCITHNLWAGLTNAIHNYLESVSLHDVCERNVVFGNVKANEEARNV